MNQEYIAQLITETVNERAAEACSSLWGVNIDEACDRVNAEGSEEQKLFKMIRSDLIRNFDVEAFVERLKENRETKA